MEIQVHFFHAECVHVSRCFCILRTRSFAPHPFGQSSVRNSQVFECVIIAFFGRRRRQWVHCTVSFLEPISNASDCSCGGGKGGCCVFEKDSKIGFSASDAEERS